MWVEEGDRQMRALDVWVVAQAWQRGRRDAQPGKLRVGAHGVVLTTVCVPKTSSTSGDQAVFVDQATGVSLPSDAVPVEIDRFG